MLQINTAIQKANREEGYELPYYDNSLTKYWLHHL